MLVATKMHVIWRSRVVLKWLHDKKRISVSCDIMKEHKVQHCNNDNDYKYDSVMHASMWFECFGGLFQRQTGDTWEECVTTTNET